MTTDLPKLTRRHIGDVTWLSTPDLASELFSEDGLRLDEWLRTGQARIVKQGPHRAVFRIELAGRTIYLKHNRARDFSSWFRDAVRSSKARREFDSAVAIAARGVPTIFPLAVGEQQRIWGHGESFLVSRSLDDYHPLNFFIGCVLPSMSGGRAVHIRQQLARELGKLVAAMHDAGIRHNDLHAANILVRTDGKGQVALAIVDLNSVSLGAPLGRGPSLRNLAMLNSWFVQRVSSADRLRFWRTYCRLRKASSWIHEVANRTDSRALVQDLEARTWRFNLHIWARRTRRCLRSTRNYRPFRHGSFLGHTTTDLDPGSLEKILADPDALFRLPGTKILKDSPTSTVAELELIVAGKPRSVIYKRFSVISWKDPAASIFRRDPALRSWVHGQGFRERGLPTARPLAVFHRIRFGMQFEGYLVTEKLEHAQQLNAYVQELQSLPIEEGRRLLLRQIEQVARTIRELHRRQISHRDLKAANVLVRRLDAPPPSDDVSTFGLDLLHVPETSVWLIDLVGVEVFQNMKWRRKVQNLARLNASFFHCDFLTRTDRLRFLRVYMNWNMRGKGDWKSWWRQIEKATLEKVARNLKRGRPLQ